MPLPLAGVFYWAAWWMADHDPSGISSLCSPKGQSPPMGTDLTALLLSSVFLGVGFIIAKYFPEASLLAGVFLVGLAILNVALFFAT